jgi:hypothetical protein
MKIIDGDDHVQEKQNAAGSSVIMRFALRPTLGLGPLASFRQTAHPLSPRDPYGIRRTSFSQNTRIKCKFNITLISLILLLTAIKPSLTGHYY